MKLYLKFCLWYYVQLVTVVTVTVVLCVQVTIRIVWSWLELGVCFEPLTPCAWYRR